MLLGASSENRDIEPVQQWELWISRVDHRSESSFSIVSILLFVLSHYLF